MSAPQRKITFGQKIKQQDDQNVDFYGLIRQKLTTPFAFNVPLGGESSPAPQAGSGFLRVVGDTMNGPIAYLAGAVTIAGGVINTSQAFGFGFHSYLIVNGQGAVNDDLDTILNATFGGQILLLQTVAGQTITLKHLTGNIRLSTGGDIPLAPQTTIQLYFDVVANQWADVVGFGGGSAGGANVMLSNLAGVAVNASLIPGLDATIDLGSVALAWDELFVGAVQFPNQRTVVATDWSIQRDFADDLVSNIPTGEQFLWSINALTQMGLNTGSLQIINPTSLMLFDIVNRNPAIIDLDAVGDIRWRADDDAGGELIQTYGRIRVNADDVSSGTIDGRMTLSVAENNVLESYVVLNAFNFPGVLQFQKNSTFRDHYTDWDAIAVPANPAVGTRRLFSNSANLDHLSVRTAGGSTIDLEATAGGAFANQQLSNLTVGGVQINTDLVPDTDVTHRLGTGSLAWSELNVRKIFLTDNISPTASSYNIGRDTFGGIDAMYFNVVLGDDIRFLEAGSGGTIFHLDTTNNRAVFGEGNQLAEIRVFGLSQLNFWSIFAPTGANNSIYQSSGVSGHQFNQFVQFGTALATAIRIDPDGDADFNANNITDINNITSASSGDISGFNSVGATIFKRTLNANINITNSVTGWDYNAELGDSHEFNLNGLPIFTITDTAIATFSGTQFLQNGPIFITHVSQAFIDFSDIPVPGVPFSGFGRVFFDNSTSPGILKIRKDDTTVISLEGGGGSQTPWLTNINAQQNDLFNVKFISGRDTGAVGSFQIIFDANEDSDTWIGDHSLTDTVVFVANNIGQMRYSPTGLELLNNIDMNLFYIQFDEVTAPATPPATEVRMFLNVANGQLSVRKDDGSIVSLEAGGSGILWSTPVNANIIPDFDNTRDLGSSANEFRDMWIDGIATIDFLQVDVGANFFGNVTMNSNLTVNGNFLTTGTTTTFGNSATDDIIFVGGIASSLIPDSTLIRDLGTFTNKFANMYMRGISHGTPTNQGGLAFFGASMVTRRTVADLPVGTPFTITGWLTMIGVINNLLQQLGPAGYNMIQVT